MSLQNAEDHQFFDSYQETENWLNKMNINKYTIDPNTLEVFVHGDTNLFNRELKIIPVKFVKVKGHYSVAHNDLISLKGSPKKVYGSFWCEGNKLTTLEAAPDFVDGSFHCYDNQLTSLKGTPKHVEGGYHCQQNQLITLQDGPTYVGGSFHCQDNQLTSLEGCPSHISTRIVFDGNENTISTVNKFIKSASYIELFNVNPNMFSLMWVFFIKRIYTININSATYEQQKVCQIINKHLQGDRSGPRCQLELIDAGLGKYIKI